MKRVLVAAALGWAAALSLAGHPALTDAAGSASPCGCSVPEDGPATRAQCGPAAIRPVRGERRAAGGGAPPVAVPCVSDAPARADVRPAPPGGTPPARTSLVSSVTRAPRAPPRA
ncbi:MAG TPA: hypothetical protein VKB80_28020 [Kofleriaceae bacterium]|nr:hypothetical protein [Kofleriaceae bacterium]